MLMPSSATSGLRPIRWSINEIRCHTPPLFYPHSDAGTQSRRLEERLEDFVRQQPPARCKKDLIVRSPQQALLDQILDVGSRSLEHIQTELVAEFAQIDS